MGILLNLDTLSSFLFGVCFGSVQTITEMSYIRDEFGEEILFDAFIELQNRIIYFRKCYGKTHWK
jgi:hypothetical protein